MRRSLKRLAFLAFSAVWAAGAALTRAVRRLARPSAGRRVVVYYHAVTAAERPRFARQMDILLRRARPVGIESLAEPAAGDQTLVTFDDGLRSVLAHALPELAARAIPCIIFVVAGAMGKAPEWGSYKPLRDQPPPAPGSRAAAGEANDTVASATELRNAAGPLVAIGSHTMTHARLTSLTAAQAHFEISASRAQLEAVIGRPVTSLSFPYGAASEEIVALCREAGYEQLFATAATAACEGPDVVRRVRADPTDWSLEFRLKLLGGYDWLPLALQGRRRLARILARRRQPARGPVAAEAER